jgi:hypothetical protein
MASGPGFVAADVIAAAGSSRQVAPWSGGALRLAAIQRSREDSGRVWRMTTVMSLFPFFLAMIAAAWTALQGHVQAAAIIAVG